MLRYLGCAMNQTVLFFLLLTALDELKQLGYGLKYSGRPLSLGTHILQVIHHYTVTGLGL